MRTCKFRIDLQRAQKAIRSVRPTRLNAPGASGAAMTFGSQGCDDWERQCRNLETRSFLRPGQDPFEAVRRPRAASSSNLVIDRDVPMIHFGSAEPCRNIAGQQLLV